MLCNVYYLHTCQTKLDADIPKASSQLQALALLQLDQQQQLLLQEQQQQHEQHQQQQQQLQQLQQQQLLQQVNYYVFLLD